GERPRTIRGQPADRPFLRSRGQARHAGNGHRARGGACHHSRRAAAAHARRGEPARGALCAGRRIRRSGSCRADRRAPARGGVPQRLHLRPSRGTRPFVPRAHRAGGRRAGVRPDGCAAHRPGVCGRAPGRAVSRTIRPRFPRHSRGFSRMLRFSAALLALSTFSLLTAAHAAVPAPPAPDLDAGSYILIDYQSGNVIAQKNADERMEPASLTKLITAYVVFAALKEGRLKLDDPVTISEDAWRTGGSRTFLKVGSQVPVIDLIKGMIVQSGNDATVALGERVGGTRAGFAQLMNE